MNAAVLQESLAALRFNPGPVDGRDGPRTREAVRMFQRKYGLLVDGIAGPATKAAIRHAIKGVRPANIGTLDSLPTGSA